MASLPHVYVLDDEESIQKLVVAALSDLGHEVFATDAWPKLCQKLMAEREEAVLVCDLHMAGINGADFCRTVKKHKPSIEIILYSGGPEGAATAQSLGIRFVSKLSGIAALKDAIAGIRRARTTRLSRPGSAD